MEQAIQSLLDKGGAFGILAVLTVGGLIALWKAMQKSDERAAKRDEQWQGIVIKQFETSNALTQGVTSVLSEIRAMIAGGFNHNGNGHR